MPHVFRCVLYRRQCLHDVVAEREERSRRERYTDHQRGGSAERRGQEFDVVRGAADAGDGKVADRLAGLEIDLRIRLEPTADGADLPQQSFLLLDQLARQDGVGLVPRDQFVVRADLLHDLIGRLQAEPVERRTGADELPGIVDEAFRRRVVGQLSLTEIQDGVFEACDRLFGVRDAFLQALVLGRQYESKFLFGHAVMCPRRYIRSLPFRSS